MRTLQHPDFHLETAFLAQGCRAVAGVDEVGRGSWAGPLVAAAVVLPEDILTCALFDPALFRDSKQLTSSQREEALRRLRALATSIGIGWATSAEISRCGLGVANRLAMIRAVQRLSPRADALILDHMALPEFSLPQTSPPRAESLSVSVAAASIVAKVTRDHLMCAWESLWPGYGFAHHKGYGTPRHRDALQRLGPCRIHRMSFAPVAACRSM